MGSINNDFGYLSYNNRYADLLFEVIIRRYDAAKAIVLSTNNVFDEWTEVFLMPPASSPPSSSVG